MAGAVAWVDAATAGGTEQAFPIPGADGVAVDRGSGVMVSRLGSRVVALSQVCPHEQADVRWRSADARFQCPRHESKFQADGTLIGGRARRHLDRLPIRREGDRLLVDPSRPIRSDRQQADWDAAVVTL